MKTVKLKNNKVKKVLADNSFGMGEYKTSFTPNRYLNFSGKPEFTYFPNDEISMFTYKCDTKFSITGRDLETLMGHKLVKVQVNKPGTISLYFKKKAEKVG